MKRNYLNFVVAIFLLLMVGASTQAQNPTAAKRINYGSSLPATCDPTTGDVFFKTTSPVGTHECTATNTWTPIRTASAGEANTASNVGTGGVGFFKIKSGVDLQFKKQNAGSSKVTITDDTANNEVDVDVVEANFNRNSLGGGALTIANGGSGATSASSARTAFGLGTSATLNVAASGNAAVGEVVKGDDTRLTNSRTPSAHAASHQHGGSDEIATATAAANAIPKASPGGKLDSWISDADASTAGKVTTGTQTFGGLKTFNNTLEVRKDQAAFTRVIANNNDAAGFSAISLSIRARRRRGSFNSTSPVRTSS